MWKANAHRWNDAVVVMFSAMFKRSRIERNAAFKSWTPQAHSNVNASKTGNTAGCASQDTIGWRGYGLSTAKI